MEPREHNGGFMQCQYCGHIYYTEQKILSDELIIKSWCPRCEHKIALNCGESKEDVYLFYDYTKDPRYYY